MQTVHKPWFHRAAVALALALPAILLFSSLRTFRELDAQREVYLRERVASIAGKIEAAESRNEPVERALESLVSEEPHLVDLRTIPKDLAQSNPGAEAVWSGRELFNTRFTEVNGVDVYRAYVPFHKAGEMNVAQIDLDAAAADFLMVHARHNVMISGAGAAALILVSLYSLWAARRMAALERNQLELRHMAQLGTMSAVLAHEIRNPLGTIKGFVQLAMEQAASIRPLLDPVLQQTGRLERLVNDLLVYGRPPSPAWRTIAWKEMADRIDAHARHLTTGDNPAILITRTDLTFDSDPDLLEQILINAIRNAVDAVQPVAHGKVIVDSVQTGAGVTLTVADNGPGIPPSDLDRVREPFFTTKAFGTGLGIPISQRLTTALGGTFEIRSVEGAGTTIQIDLPFRIS